MEIVKKELYYPKHFYICDLVPPETYKAESAAAILNFEPAILHAIDQAWEHFRQLRPDTEIIINNWLTCGTYKYRGYRPADCTVGAPNSMHRICDGHKCGAVDMTIKGFSADDARKEILKNRNKFSGITRMENKVSWVHIDCKKTDQKGILCFDP